MPLLGAVIAWVTIGPTPLPFSQNFFYKEAIRLCALLPYRFTVGTSRVLGEKKSHEAKRAKGTNKGTTLIFFANSPYWPLWTNLKVFLLSKVYVKLCGLSRKKVLFVVIL